MSAFTIPAAGKLAAGNETERGAPESAIEAALVVTCLRGLPFPVPTDLNWNVLMHVATRHGVLGLVHRSVSERGVQPPGFFVEAASTARQRSETLALSLEELLHSFAERGIDVLPLKGPVLAQSLYGNAAARPSVDLDLLVRAADVIRAEALLFDLGFTARCPSDYDRTFQRGLLSVELHSKIASPRYCSFSAEGLWRRSRPGSFRGQPIRTMTSEDLVLYLCAHGLKHGFRKLLWILDLANALNRQAGLSYQSLVKCARRERMLPWLLVGCEVVRTTFPQHLPEELDRLIGAQPRAAQRARQTAETLFMSSRAVAVADHREFYLLAEPSALRRWRYRLGFLLPTPSDRLWAQRHPVAGQLAAFARPFRLLRKYGPARLWQTIFPPAA